MIYYGKIMFNGRDCYATICDGFRTSRIYARTENELRADIARYGYRSVTELTAKMCRGGRVTELQINTIHKLTK